MSTLITIIIPPCRSIAEKGPTTDEKLASLEVTISNYEAKVS